MISNVKDTSYDSNSSVDTKIIIKKEAEMAGVSKLYLAGMFPLLSASYLSPSLGIIFFFLIS